MAREVFGTGWIKLEVIADGDTLCPDVFGRVEAAAVLNREGFEDEQALLRSRDDSHNEGREAAAACMVSLVTLGLIAAR